LDGLPIERLRMEDRNIKITIHFTFEADKLYLVVGWSPPVGKRRELTRVEIPTEGLFFATLPAFVIGKWGIALTWGHPKNED
jgi:hypothetical protein